MKIAHQLVANSLLPLLSVALLPVTIPAQRTKRLVDGRVLQEVRQFVESERVSQRIPGLSLALVLDDQLVWSEGFGFANLESGLRAKGSTIYRIGSVSKPLVGTALMQLVEEGQVDLEADIRDYVPEWPEKRWDIQVHHLMTHTAGIRHYNGSEFLSMRRYEDLAGPLDIFKDDPLLFEPGTRHSYSTYGFNIVANVVEDASGQPISEYMREKVYEPAWMNNTGLEDHTALQLGRSHWYETDADGNWINAPYVDLSNKYAGGGITSTVEDLARWHIAYARGRLLKPETIEEMYQPRALNDGSLHGYGLAWRVQEVELPDGTKTRLIGHSGGSVGANTLFLRYPDKGMAIAVIANHRAQLRRITSGVMQRVLDGTR
ncbi:MAG: serine hydrolase domain-containing protein [Planctomycetota bacterium]|jgi:CubicO group peptidase (beta-lactamase class C family)